MTGWNGEDGSRDLVWDGCYNARDLGGLPLATGGVTALGTVVRADSPDQLSPAGWAAVWDYGVRTIIDLRCEDECAVGVERPRGLVVHRVSWDDYPDQEWKSRYPAPGLPASMNAFLDDYPNAVADAARVLIDAAPGAVLVHCAGGRDRTGLFALVLGALVGVSPDALFADYHYSFARLLPLYRLTGLQREIDFLEADGEAEHRAQAFGLARTVIDGLDADAVEKVLLNGGLSRAELDALRTRILGGGGAAHIGA